jgi:hypothetical protein
MGSRLTTQRLRCYRTCAAFVFVFVFVFDSHHVSTEHSVVDVELPHNFYNEFIPHTSRVCV